MTTPPQPQNQNSAGNSHPHSRKRPAPGTGAPTLSSVSATAASTAMSDSGMGYLNLPTTSVGMSGAGLYSSSPGLADSYLAGRSDIDQTTAATQAGALNLPTTNDNAGRLARINRGHNSLIRMPYSLQTGGAMPAPAVQMNLLNGAAGTTNLGQVMGPGPPNDGIDPFDRDLHLRIEKMRKKRASIPPFVQKLSRSASNSSRDLCLLFPSCSTMQLFCGYFEGR